MNQNGQILVESIVGISIAIIALTGVLNLLTSSIGINKDVGAQFTATYLAAEGTEIVKSLINSNYADPGQPGWNAGLSEGAYEFEHNTVNTSGHRIGDSDTMSNSNLFYNNSNGIYGYGGGGSSVETSFQRTIQVENIDRGGGSEADEMVVRSIVEWTGRGGDQESITIEDHFFDWRP